MWSRPRDQDAFRLLACSVGVGWSLQPSDFGNVSPEALEPGAEHVGVGMAQVLEDGKGLLPGVAGGPLVAGGVVGVAEQGADVGIAARIHSAP